MVGSTTTVAANLGEMAEGSRGLHTLFVTKFDFKDEYPAWSASQQALVEDVLPQFNRSAAA